MYLFKNYRTLRSSPFLHSPSICLAVSCACPLFSLLLQFYLWDFQANSPTHLCTSSPLDANQQQDSSLLHSVVIPSQVFPHWDAQFTMAQMRSFPHTNVYPRHSRQTQRMLLNELTRGMSSKISQDLALCDSIKAQRAFHLYPNC